MRKTEYVLPDGTRTTSRQKGAIILTPGEIRSFVSMSTSQIPAGYFVATAWRESGFATNEVDTETNGFVSWGLYQVSAQEALDVGLPHADLLSPMQSTEVFVRLAKRNLDIVLRAVGGVAKTPDVYAYLAIAHNEGLYAVRKTIKLHGLDWGDPLQFRDPLSDQPGTYRYRNAGRKIVSYGDAVLKEISAPS